MLLEDFQENRKTTIQNIKSNEDIEKEFNAYFSEIKEESMDEYIGKRVDGEETTRDNFRRDFMTFVSAVDLQKPFDHPDMEKVLRFASIPDKEFTIWKNQIKNYHFNGDFVKFYPDMSENVPVLPFSSEEDEEQTAFFVRAVSYFMYVVSCETYYQMIKNDLLKVVPPSPSSSISEEMENIRKENELLRAELEKYKRNYFDAVNHNRGNYI